METVSFGQRFLSNQRNLRSGAHGPEQHPHPRVSQWYPEWSGKMATHGVDVFDKTLQTTHIWLNEIGETIGPDRHVAWHVLSAVLRTLRDRMPIDLAAHLGSQLPLLVRGTYYDQWMP